MVRNLLLTFLVFFCVAQVAVAQSSTATIEGRVIDDLGDGAAFANVAVYQGDNLVRGVETDLDGNYAITNLNPGTYDLEATYVGLNPQRQAGVQLLANRIVRLNFELTKGINLEEVVVIDYKVPLIQVDETSSGGIKTAEDIKNLPIKNITGIAATTAGVTTRGDDTNIRGARAESTVFILDGIVTRGALPPQTEIEQLELITGGLEAKYGDVIGGVISLTSKGPSSKYSGYFEVESSELTDAYGYNLLNASLSGPILKNSKGKSILGFRLAGQYRRQEDDNPSGVGVFRATPEIISDLTSRPDTMIGSSRISRAEFVVDNNNVEFLDARPNEREIKYDFTGKLDLRVSDAVDVTLSGTYNSVNDRFIPGSAQVGGTGGWSLLNHVNNPLDENVRYRGNIRLRHRIGYANAVAGEDSERKEQPVIGGVTYSLQAGYEHFDREISDWRHGSNIFDYGHIGTYDLNFDPTIRQLDLTTADSSLARFGTTIFNPQTGLDETYAHVGFTENLVNYTPGTANPGLTSQNRDQEGEALGTIFDYEFYNGLRENVRTNAWQGTHNNVGSVYDRFSRTQLDQYSGNVQLSLELYPTKSKANRHAVEFGFLYEQRTNRFWRADPTELWTVMRQQANAHLQFIDTTAGAVGMQDFESSIGAIQVPVYRGDTIGSTINGNGLFWQRLRASQEVDADLFTQVNIDGLDPSVFSLDMFSASELIDRDIVSYYGYDYAGNKTTGNITFDDFFTSTVNVDDLGLNREIRNFPIAPLQPIYWAAYIQDKFSVKDVIFKLGVRVDRYDANTKVLRDPFSLYAIQNADDFYSNNPELIRPNISDDANVYVADEGSTDVVGFRVGEQWFDADGEAVINSQQVFRGSPVRAALVSPDSDIREVGFKIDESFEDFKPQINVAPRIAISFPISDVANFFAHYDVLVQRPGFGQTNATALQYYDFNRNAGFIDNPNLKPQKTIDYEVGFKQKVTNTSALTLAAYYRELRDLIQLRTFRDLPQSQNNSVPEYLSYDNIDFGTTYGFTAQWDMRRTGNLQLNINYTLAFADGTGSDVNSSNDFNDNIRVLSPLSFDERHAINVIADYRYASGNAYNGPKIGDMELFANTGLNVQGNLISGRPYSRAQRPSQLPDSGGQGFLGSINGARLPWVFNVDARLDRNINLTKPGAKNPMSINLYVRVTNLFDRENVINVFNATGSAEDDGFLAIDEGQRLLQNLDAAERLSFLNAYNWGQLAPGFFTAPRRIFLGAIFQF